MEITSEDEYEEYEKELEALELRKKEIVLALNLFKKKEFYESKKVFRSFGIEFLVFSSKNRKAENVPWLIYRRGIIHPPLSYERAIEYVNLFYEILKIKLNEMQIECQEELELYQITLFE